MNDLTLTAEERHALLSVLRELDEKAPAEKRRNPRRKVCEKLWIRPLGRRMPQMPAILVNQSAQGLGLQVERPLQTGEKFLLRLRFVEGGGWLVLCETRNCRQLRQAYLVGAKIVDRIEDPEGTNKPPMDWLL